MVEIAFFCGGVLVGVLGTVLSIHARRWLLKQAFWKPHVPDTIPTEWLE